MDQKPINQEEAAQAVSYAELLYNTLPDRKPESIRQFTDFKKARSLGEIARLGRAWVKLQVE